jgi:predicted Zn-dependent protease
VLLGALERSQALEAAAAQRPQEAAELRGRAIESIGMALDASPEHAGANRLAGLLLMDEGNWQDAAYRLRRALAAAPGDGEARRALVDVLLQQGEGEAAREEALRLVQDEPGRDDGWGLLALARLATDDRDGARQALAEHDRLASMREAAGLAPHLPEFPAFAELRTP